MTDVEWIAEVRKYALEFGEYNFSAKECKHMTLYLRHVGVAQNVAWVAQYGWICKMTLPAVWELMDEFERSLVQAVTDKLTQ